MPLSCQSLRRPPSNQSDPWHSSLQRRRSCAELSGIGHAEPTGATEINSSSMVCLNHNPQPPLDCPSNIPAHPNPYHHYHHHHQHQYIYQLRNQDHPHAPGSIQPGDSTANAAGDPAELLHVMEQRRHRINECRLMSRTTPATGATTKNSNPPNLADGLTSSTLL